MSQQQSTSLLNLLCKCFNFKRRGNAQYDYIRNPIDIPPISEKKFGMKTLIIDLDETLVHSSFEPIPNYDLTIQMELQQQMHKIYVCVRPGAQEFLVEMSKFFEIFIFTASISEYANPVIDYLDPKGVVDLRLFRDNCTLFKGLLVKDLSQMKRCMQDLILIDNSVNSFMFQPLNAIHIVNFIDDKQDKELNLMMPFLRMLADFGDVRPVHEWLFKYAHLEKMVFIDKKGETQEFNELPTSSESQREKLTQQLDTPKLEESKILIIDRQMRGIDDMNEMVELKNPLDFEITEKQSKQSRSSEIKEIRQSLNINSPHQVNIIINFPNNTDEK